MKNKNFTTSLKYSSILGLLLLLNACSKNPEINNSETQTDVPPIDKSLVPNPPMGWNSWDSFGWTVNEAQVRENAEYMAKNLKSLGYEYIVVDANWYADKKGSDFEDFVHERNSIEESQI